MKCKITVSAFVEGAGMEISSAMPGLGFRQNELGVTQWVKSD
jgi:hypothetical protein